MNKRQALGNNPLGNSIFKKTEKEETIIETPPIKKRKPKDRTIIFLEECEKEKVNLRIPLDINDWIDERVKQGKRRHGKKISKELWVQAALEFFRILPLDWHLISDIQSLKKELQRLESIIKHQDSLLNNEEDI